MKNTLRSLREWLSAAWLLLRFSYRTTPVSTSYLLLFTACIVVLGVYGDGHWTAYLICATMHLIWWTGTYGHWQRLRKLERQAAADLEQQAARMKTAHLREMVDFGNHVIKNHAANKSLIDGHDVDRFRSLHRV